MLCSVLDDQRKPLGYIDVAALKARWEAGGADPVSLPHLRPLFMSLYSTNLT
jgi:hypothetical protein